MLFRAHWEELTTHKDLMVLKPDVDRYREAERAGMMEIIAAFHGLFLVG